MELVKLTLMCFVAIFLGVGRLEANPVTNTDTAVFPSKLPNGITGSYTEVSSSAADMPNKNKMYTRLFPAIATVGVFLFGVLVIFIKYLISVRFKAKRQLEPLNNEPLNSDWLTALKQTQGKKDSLFGRRGSLFPGSRSKIKKYALYDEMLAKYKRKLKMQKQHSMRRAAGNISTDSALESMDDGSVTSTLKRVNSKQRMKDLAMRHRISQEHHIGNNLVVSSRERYLPRWGTTISVTSSTYEEPDGNVSKLTPSSEDNDAFREVLDRSIEMSVDTSFHISTDDDTQVLIEPQESVIVHNQPDEFSSNLLDQPEIKEELKKLSPEEVIIQPIKTNSRKRPKSMFAGLSLKGTILKEEDEKQSSRRLSWYQGLFNNSGNSKVASTSKHVIDEMIQEHMEKARISRLPVIEKQDGSVSAASKETRKRPRSCIGNIRGNKIFEEVDINDDIVQKPKRPISLTILEKLKEKFSGSSEYSLKSDQSVENQAITELFANLMDISTADESVDLERDTSENKRDSLFGKEKDKRKSRPRTAQEVDDMLKAVEERMIENLHTREDIGYGEVAALENLLNDVARFCKEFSEDFEDTESRRQLSFSKANEELIEVEMKSSEAGSSRQESEATNSRQPSFEDRRDKVMSVCDTDLLDAEPVIVDKFTSL